MTRKVDLKALKEDYERRPNAKLKERAVIFGVTPETIYYNLKKFFPGYKKNLGNYGHQVRKVDFDLLKKDIEDFPDMPLPDRAEKFKVTVGTLRNNILRFFPETYLWKKRQKSDALMALIKEDMDKDPFLCVAKRADKFKLSLSWMYVYIRRVKNRQYGDANSA